MHRPSSCVLSQLVTEQHEELEGCFEGAMRETVRHTMGHVIPSQRGWANRYLAFMQQHATHDEAA